MWPQEWNLMDQIFGICYQILCCHIVQVLEAHGLSPITLEAKEVCILLCYTG